jgi:hypothetical protein
MTARLKQVWETRTQREGANNNQSEPVAKHPKYLCTFIWSNLFNNDFFSPTAWYMLSDPPLPRPLQEEFKTDAMTTVHHHLHLFKATSPIIVDSFERLRASHPNQLFVDSVCVSPCEGSGHGSTLRRSPICPLGTIPINLPNQKLRQSFSMSNKIPRLRLAATLSCLEKICFWECTVHPFMPFTNLYLTNSG